ncbi:IS1634 family transposase [Leekyejoonella antrihumi]|uniref:IS1634 family transposase n=1 Tax=Leekyejoonella antrihumi TaxID=1660198 RepID=A0A563DQZ3_9MICO|nr:IS1634 family transposase [Leekyejoonella antrihumi]TWP32362.1 IS1634 family transposase [Leekyejoonella antrihumi]
MPGFIRKVKTASGATAVQIVEKQHGVRRIVEHVGSAHTSAQLAVLMQAARQRLHQGQQALDFDVPAGEGVEAAESGDDVAPAAGSAEAVVAGQASQVLWDVLADAYARLGFDRLDDEAFKSLVLARIVQPTSMAAAAGVLEDLGMPAPHRNTFYAALKRCYQRDYRGMIAKACLAHSSATRDGLAALVMYDLTTLYFEIENEDDLRKVGMSKERRVDPQITVGLLVDPGGFPLELHCFEGNKAETKTLIPVLTSFQERHGITDMVVVADAGMLSASNLNAIEEAGFSFIVGSRISKAPYDLADHFQRHGDHFADGEILESTRMMGRGKAARERRVVYQYSFKRRKHDDKAINAMVARAEKVADGTRPAKKDRFVKLNGKDTSVDWGLVERARQLAGLKGYVSNIPTDVMAGSAVIAAYHDLWQVEKSFRMSKNDLAARPIWHHTRQPIEAHLTVVFAALAISRHLQDTTGVSIKKIVTTLRPLRTVQVRVDGHGITAAPVITTAARDILDQLPPINAPGH